MKIECLSFTCSTKGIWEQQEETVFWISNIHSLWHSVAEK